MPCSCCGPYGAYPAMRELSPPPLNRMPAPILRASIQMFNAKYGIRERDVEQHDRQLLLEFDAIRTALPNGKRYLCESFSYADIAIGIALQALKPIPGSTFGPVSEQLGREGALSERYAEPDRMAGCTSCAPSAREWLDDAGGTDDT